jgi:hypothetical protein
MKTIFPRGLAALLLVVICLALAPVAMAQVAQPGVLVGRRTDTLPKQVSETAIAVILNQDGRPVASRLVFDVNKPECEFYKSARMWLDYRLANVVTDRLEVTFFPDTTDLGDKIDKETAKALYDSLRRIDIGNGRDYKSKQNLYGGELKSLRYARVGVNGISLRTITHHANSTEVLSANSTDWRRNFLNSDLSVVVVDECDKGAILLMAKANGYVFSDREVDAKLARLVAQQQQPPQIVQTQQGQDDQQTTQDTQTDDRGNNGRDVDVRGQNEVASKVEFNYKGRACDDLARLSVDERLEVWGNQNLKVEIYEILQTGEKCITDEQIDGNCSNGFRFQTPGKFRVEARSKDGRRLIGMITVEVK